MAERYVTIPALDAQDITRFYELIDQRGPDECWPWKASRFAGGYGQWKRYRRNLKSHRVAYFLHFHVDPLASLVCHSCDNPPCCNPRHLFLGSWKDNIVDCANKGRLPKFLGDKHWSHRKPHLITKGGKVGGAKLTAEQVDEIRRDYLTGKFTQRQIADRFSVCRETIGVVVRGDRWKHLPVDRDAVLRIGREHRDNARSLHRHAIVRGNRV